MLLPLQVQERQEARDTYDDAVAAGHTGVMMEQDESMPDVFTCRLGNLPPNAHATIKIIYVMQVRRRMMRKGLLCCCLVWEADGVVGGSYAGGGGARGG